MNWKKISIKYPEIFRLDRSRIESHFEIFLRFFTVEVLAGLIILFVSFLWFNFVGNEYNLIDFKYFIRSNIIQSRESDIVVVTLDNDEYNSLKNSPIYGSEFINMHDYTFPRKYLRHLIEKLEKMKPRLIGIDILLDRPAAIPQIDDQFANISQKYNNLVFCSTISKWRNAEILPLNKYWDQDKHIVGHAILEESNGVYRYVRHFLRMDNGQIVPSFAMACFLKSKGFRSNISVRNYLETKLDSLLKIIRVPFSGEELFSAQFISYSSIAESAERGKFKIDFRTYNSDLILGNKIPTSWLKDKIVLIGGAYDESNDFGKIPINPENEYLPLVFIHASILHDLLTHSYIKRVKPIHMWLISVLMISLIFLLFETLTLGKAIFGSILLVIIFCAVNIKLFIAHNAVYFPLEVPLVIFSFTILIFIFLSFYRKESVTHYIRKIWSPYVPEQRLKSIIDLSHSGAVKPGGVGKAEIITMLYLKFEGLDKLLPAIDEPDLAKYDYSNQIKIIDYILEILKSEVVFTGRHQGATERFLGNSIIFYFGIPVGDVSNKKEAIRAIQCATELQRKFSLLKNTSLKLKKHCPDLNIKMCIHSGGIVIGAVRNLDNRLEPTLLTNMIEEIQNIMFLLSQRPDCPNLIITEPSFRLLEDLVSVSEVNMDKRTIIPFKLYKVEKLNKMIDEFVEINNVYKSLNKEELS